MCLFSCFFKKFCFNVPTSLFSASRTQILSMLELEHPHITESVNFFPVFVSLCFIFYDFSRLFFRFTYVFFLVFLLSAITFFCIFHLRYCAFNHWKFPLDFLLYSFLSSLCFLLLFKLVEQNQYSFLKIYSCLLIPMCLSFLNIILLIFSYFYIIFSCFFIYLIVLDQMPDIVNLTLLVAGFGGVL